MKKDKLQRNGAKHSYGKPVYRLLEATTILAVPRTSTTAGQLITHLVVMKPD